MDFKGGGVTPPAVLSGCVHFFLIFFSYRDIFVDVFRHSTINRSAPHFGDNLGIIFLAVEDICFDAMVGIVHRRDRFAVYNSFTNLTANPLEFGIYFDDDFNDLNCDVGPTGPSVKVEDFSWI